MRTVVKVIVYSVIIYVVLTLFSDKPKSDEEILMKLEPREDTNYAPPIEIPEAGYTKRDTTTYKTHYVTIDE